MSIEQITVSIKQRKLKFEPREKLNHNSCMYICDKFNKVKVILFHSGASMHYDCLPKNGRLARRTRNTDHSSEEKERGCQD